MKRLFLTAIFLLLLTRFTQAETLSLSTFYPAPFGVYNRMTLVPQAGLLFVPPFNGFCNVNNDGTMWIDSDSGRLWYCMTGNPRIVESVWQQVANDISPADELNPNIRVGIGTGVTAPAQKLHVLAPGPTIARIEGATAAPRIEFAQSNALPVVQSYLGSSAVHALIVENSTPLPQFYVTQNGAVGVKVVPAASIMEVLGAGIGPALARVRIRSVDNQAGVSFASDDIGEVVIYSADGANDMRFFVAGDRMTILDTGDINIPGNIGVAKAPDPNYKLDILGVPALAIPPGIGALRLQSGAPGESLIYNSVGDLVLTGGDMHAEGFFYLPSDISLKKNIKKAPGLATIMRLKGISFDWKKTGDPDFGVSAQDLEKVFPALVAENPVTHKKAVKYASLIAPLIEAIKEQQQQIDALKKEISDLRSER